MEIDWNYPQPRKGIKGMIDRFLGPGMTPGELFINIAGLILLSCVILFPLYLQGMNWTIIQWIVCILVTIDICGGVLTLALSPAKRWVHRDGKGFFSKFSFVLLHIHPIIIGLLFNDALWGISVYLLVVIAAALVLSVPIYLQRPMGVFFIALSVVIAGLIPAPAGFFWFVPLFFLKLIGGHCTREEPYRP